MKPTIIIPVHSVIDVITNSSSEVFVTANEKTVSIVKDILKLFLENANVSLPVESVFDVELVYRGYDDNDQEVDKVGTSDYSPSKIRVTIKENHEGNYGELVKLMNRLNDAFVGVEFMT